MSVHRYVPCVCCLVDLSLLCVCLHLFAELVSSMMSVDISTALADADKPCVPLPDVDMSSVYLPCSPFLVEHSSESSLDSISKPSYTQASPMSKVANPGGNGHGAATAARTPQSQAARSSLALAADSMDMQRTLFALSISELKTELKKRGLPCSGNHMVLAHRLLTAIEG